MLSALSQHTSQSEARPARDVRRVPQRRTPCEAGSVPRRDVGRPAHPRDSARVGTTRSTRPTGYTFPSPSNAWRSSTRRCRRSAASGPKRPSTLKGDHVQLDGAYCDPKPLQQLPAVWVGGGGEQKTLRIAARHADATNWQVGIEDFVRKSKILEQHCEQVGRPFEEITRTHGPDCRIFDSDADTQSLVRGTRWRKPLGPDPDRRIPARQSGWYRRAGDREDPEIRGCRLQGIRLVDEGLSL